MYLAEMTHDRNPIYAETEYAKSCRYKGVIAPLTSFLVWLQPRNTQIGIDAEQPDIDDPSVAPFPEPAKPEQKMSFFRVPGMTDVIVQNIKMSYFAPFRPGDRVSAVTELADCSPEKQTRRGPGHFVTFRHSAYNSGGQLMGRAELTHLQYRRA
jgi:acyl dehydratase